MNLGIFDIFSKRKKRRENAGKVEPYRYDVLPDRLRMQVIHLWVSAIGRWTDIGRYSDHPKCNVIWIDTHNNLAREYGVGALGKASQNPQESCFEHLMTGTADEALDIIELTFRAIDTSIRDDWSYSQNSGTTQKADEAIAELNHRFKEHAIGYEFLNGEIVRVGSEFLHAEVIVPAMTLLRELRFNGAEDEFAKAHQHYRHGRIEECLTDALKAFESTMKTICERRKWKVDPRANAKDLIDVVFKNDLIPEVMRTHFAGVRGALESGVPTIRNKMGGHGQGAEVRAVPPYWAAHILHLTGANILLLIEAHKAMK